MGSNRNIGLLVDEYSRLKFDIHISTKNQLQEQVPELLKIIFVNFKIKVQVIQMDNAEEKIYIKKAIRSDPKLCEMGTVVEYTAPYTPQQNGKVECAFPTLFSRACAACNGAKLPIELRKNYFVKPSERQYKKMLFYIHEDEIQDPRTMLFLEKMHLT